MGTGGEVGRRRRGTATAGSRRGERVCGARAQPLVNTIVNNVVDQADNRPSTAGISLEHGRGHRVLNNTVTRGSGDGIILRAGSNPLPGSGVILPPVTEALVSGNVVTRNGLNAANVAATLAGINLQRNATTGRAADNNQLVGNRVVGNADHGIYVASQDNRIVSNQARGNAVHDLRRQRRAAVRQQRVAQQHLHPRQPGLRQGVAPNR